MKRETTEQDNESPLRYGIIGAGDMARTHSMNIAQRPDLFQVVALCDTCEDHMARTQEKLHPDARPAERYSDYRRLLDNDEVEAVIVATPNGLHTRPVVDALEAGKHVLCEKPFATSLEDCDRMIEARDRTGMALQVGLVLRYSRAFQQMASFIRAGRIGRPAMAWCHEFRPPFPIGDGREWRFETARSGGAILEKDCHHFDLFEWMLGSRTTRVQAFGGAGVIESEGCAELLPGYEDFLAKVRHNDIVDHAVVNLEFENGSMAALLVCFFAMNTGGLPLGVLGSKGRTEIFVTRGLESFILHENARTEEYVEQGTRGETVMVSETQTGEGFIIHPGGLRQHLAFRDVVRKGKPVFCSAEIGRNSVAVGLAAEESIRRNGAIVEVAASS